MSELGQTEKSGRTTRKSASPLTPDIVNAGGHVSKVPIVLKKSFFADD